MCKNLTYNKGIILKLSKKKLVQRVHKNKETKMPPNKVQKDKFQIYANFKYSTNLCVERYVVTLTF